jgi:hypothetical protein
MTRPSQDAKKGGPIEHRCVVCQKPGATHGVGNAWHCRPCRPPGFYPSERGEG